ncbi:MAG: hypothetical protein WC609_02480 [Candidatus Paceibacterota bacterium]|jgi:hypothetical protein
MQKVYCPRRGRNSFPTHPKNLVEIRDKILYNIDMLNAMENLSEPSPKITFREKRKPKVAYGDNEKGKTKYDEIILKSIEDKENAVETLVGNVGLYNDCIEGLIRKIVPEMRDRSAFASAFVTIENALMIFCQNLNEQQIKKVVEYFIEGLLKYIGLNRRDISIGLGNLDDGQYEAVRDGVKEEIGPTGTISIVEYLRTQKEFYGSDSDKKFAAYVNPKWDKECMIDIVGCIYRRVDGQFVIDEINLIQVKSTKLNETERKKVEKTMRNWLKSSVMDLATFEGQHKKGIPDNIEKETLSRNADEVKNFLKRLCKDIRFIEDPKNLEPEAVEEADKIEADKRAEEFISKQDLRKLNDQHKIWLLLKRCTELRGIVLASLEEKILTENQAQAILRALGGFENSAKIEIAKQKKFAGVDNINCVIVERENVWSEKLTDDKSGPYAVALS